MEKETDLTMFNQLFAEYHKQFIGFAFSYIQDKSVAEDFTMEAFMKYWENRSTLQVNSNVPAYILTIIKNKCLNYLEHLQVEQMASENITTHTLWKVHVQISTLKACDPNELFSNEIQEIIEKTLASLPKRTREIFEMSRFKNMTNKEIANQENMTVKGVEFHISKALKVFRKAMKDYIAAFIYLFL